MLAVLRRRNFALLWSGGLLSMIGDWVLLTALPFALYERTGSALATSALLMAALAPSCVLGSVAGVFVDRWDRRRTMIVADLVRAALLLLLVRTDERLWLIYAVAFCQATITTFFGPAENALLPTLVGKADLVPANALNALNNNLARLLGPPLGGALFGLLGLPGVVLLDSASFVISGVLIALVVVPPVPTGPPPLRAAAPEATVRASVWREWAAGLGVIRRERLIAGVFVVAGLAMFADSMNSALLVPFMDEILRGGAQGFGWLLSIQAIGGLLGSVVIGRAGTLLPPGRLLALSLATVGVLSLVLVSFPSLALALVFSAIGGVPAVGYLVSQQTLLQRGVPDAYRGRVFGAWETTTALLRLAGLGLAGGLGDVVGILPLLYVMGGLRVLSGAIAFLVLPDASPQTTACRESHPDMATNTAGKNDDK